MAQGEGRAISSSPPPPSLILPMPSGATTAAQREDLMPRDGGKEKDKKLGFPLSSISPPPPPVDYQFRGLFFGE